MYLPAILTIESRFATETIIDVITHVFAVLPRIPARHPV
jgi:hypothetical protein